MESKANNNLELQISEWKIYLSDYYRIQALQLEQLELQLRAQISLLQDSGLNTEEAFLVAAKRIENLDDLSREFKQEQLEWLSRKFGINFSSKRIWGRSSPKEILIMSVLALCAGLSIKVPELFGVHLVTDNDTHFWFYGRNLSLFVMPFLTTYFIWKRRLPVVNILWLLVVFLVVTILVNIYSFSSKEENQLLTVLHLPIFLWLVVGFVYIGGKWNSSTRRMEFVRFSGELFIYYILIALGGGVFTMFTIFMFTLIDVDISEFVAFWLIPCGALGAVIVGSWVIETKQKVMENIAPILAKIFTPFFVILLFIFLITIIWARVGINVERELLIGIDLLLVFILGLLIYNVSARDSEAPLDIFDVLQLILAVSALIVDLLVLVAIVNRIFEFGFSPNKLAALGENLILLINLLLSIWLYCRFLLRKGTFSSLERWQTAYLPIYPVWALIVVVFFPPVFGYA